MRIFRLSLEALDALQATLDEVNTERRGDVTVRIAIDDGLKIKLDQGTWTRPYDLTVESRDRESYAHVDEIDGNSFPERVQTALVDARLVLRRLESGAAITPSEVNSALAGIDSVMT
jgi:hypothetical protein